jgi:photosystem II stability/assembly factor-like uncharacterized protein
MKRKFSRLVLYLFFLFFSISSHAQGVWELQNPIPTSEYLESIFCMPNSTTAWTVGANGTILKTVDGNSWVRLNSGTTSYLESAFFYDSNIGWAVGREGTIIKTNNGGSSWTAQTSGVTNPLRSVCFIDKNTGWIAGDFTYENKSSIIKTINGGNSWIAQIIVGYRILAIHFVNSNIGWAVGVSGAILKTTDGGTTWVAQTSGTSYTFYGVYFTDVNTGWAVGQVGMIYKTIDGGTTWFAQTSNTTNPLTNIFMINTNTGWAVGASGTLVKTTNGGTNWIVQTSGTTNDLRDIRFSNSNNGWAVGLSGTIIKSTDWGSTWATLTSGTSLELRSINMVDANTGFVVGGKYLASGPGIILKTTNGGNIWTTLLNYTYGFNSAYFINSTIGWVVGENGTILKTTNGGISWTIQTSGTTSPLYGVFFTDSNNGWAAGGPGTIIKTTNGGTTWTTLTSGTTDWLYAIFFTDINNGYVATGVGNVLKTTNGGTTWTSYLAGGNNLKSLYFINANTGWAGGFYGTIRKTINGGITWPAQTIDYTGSIYGVYFIDANKGWAVGDKIFKTSDGGTTWNPEASVTSSGMKSIRFIDDRTGWAVGTSGVILHYTNYSPTTQASSLNISGTTYQNVNISWTRGNGNQSALFAKQASTGNCVPDVDVTYLPNSTFGLGDQVGSTGWYCVYNGSGTFATINGLQANTAYRFQVCEYNYGPDFTHYNSTTATNNPITTTTAIAPPQITANPRDTTLCETLTAIFTTAATGSGLSYQWQVNAGSGYLNVSDGTVYSGSTNAILILTGIPANLSANKYHCLVTNSSGSATSGAATLTVNPLPVNTSGISGNQEVCINSNYIYTVMPIQYASTYIWSSPAGFSGNDSTNNITLTPGNNAVSGIISIKGKNACGFGPVKEFTVNVKHLPENASAITGLDKVCTGSINVGYATSAIIGADYYIWSLPFGATGTSSINSIMINYSSDPLTGQIKVKGHNMCGDGAESILPLTITTVPSAIGTISGSSNACKNQNAVLYTINPIPNAASYSWKLPPGVIGSNSTNSVSLNFGPDAYSGDLKVSGVNSCGTGAEIILPVTVNAVPDPVGAVSGPAIVCKGQTNVLYTVAKSERATTYIWDLPDGTRETTVTNKITLNFGSTSSSGNLYVTPYNSCGAGNSSALYIEVSSPPPPTISAASLTDFCSGDSVQLSISEVINTTYQWFKDGGTTGSNSNTFYAKESGRYTINITNSNGCTASSINSVSLQVNPVPASGSIELSGPAQFCAGGNIKLSVPVATGLEYKWSNEEGPIAGADTSFFTATVSGKYQLDISNAYGCSVKTYPVNISVKPVPGKPVITASDNYHRGECMSETPVKLSIISVAGYTYQWYKNGISQVGATLSSYEGFHTAGDYTVETDLNGCKSLSDKLNLDYASGPEKPYIYVQGPTIWYLACSNSTATKYKWYCNDKLIEGADKYFYVANRRMGDYQVSIGNDKGCYTRSDIVTIPTGVTGINDIDPFEGMKIYPNPTPGLFTIEMDNEIFGELQISIITEQGKDILSIKFEKTTEHFSSQVDLNGQSKGIYLINILIEKYSAIRKVIVE